MFDLYPRYNATPMTELAMQLPMYQFGAPYAIDWNGDGVLDLWHHNHYEFSKTKGRWSDPSTRIRPVEDAPGGCMADWDAVIQTKREKFYSPKEGFIEWSEPEFGYTRCLDVHSTAYLDINNDGRKDLFLITGGGRGVANSHEFDNMLFLGARKQRSNPGSSRKSTKFPELDFVLSGGRGAAYKANIHGLTKDGNERGRHQSWMDVDGDGFLDLVTLNDERNDDNTIPGYLYRNIDGSTFEKITSKQGHFNEFASVALLTDLDGDGFAHELIVASECSKKPNWVCRRAPLGAISVYKLTFEEPYLVLQSTARRMFDDRDKVKGISSGDFDWDGLPDVLILWGKRITIHLSSRRAARCKARFPTSRSQRQTCLNTLDYPDGVINLEKKCGASGASAFRLADFDLDGKLDMLVICADPGRHLYYQLKPGGVWAQKTKRNGRIRSLGQLNDPALMLGGKNFCEGIPTMEASERHSPVCETVFNRRRCRNVKYKAQFKICSERAQNPNDPSTRAIGVTAADMNNDGYTDLIVSYHFGAALMFENNLGKLGPKKRFLTVRLDRSAGEAASIGAIIKLKVKQMGPNADEKFTQLRVLSSLSHEADANGGHEDRLIFGLGKKGMPLELRVRWPHCCDETVIRGTIVRKYMNSMMKPFEVPSPGNCNRSCFFNRP